MHLHVNAYQEMQHVCTQMAFFDLKFATDLSDKVAEPLLLYHKDLEGRLKRLVLSEEKLESGIASLKAKVKAERASCQKGWTELTKEYREWQRSLAAGEAKKIEKLEKNFLQRREKLRQQFIKFEQMVESANAEYKSYWTKELPSIVTAYEVLEVERCNELEARMQDFRTIQSELTQPFPGMLAMIDQAVRSINGREELKGFVDAVVAQGGRPEAPLAFVDGLPTDSRTLAEQANQQQLGALLNQEPTVLASQREAAQLRVSGTVLGPDATQPSQPIAAAAAYPSSSRSSESASLSPSSSYAASSAGSYPASSSPAASNPPARPVSTSAFMASSGSPAAAASASAPVAPAPASSSGEFPASDPFGRLQDPPLTFVRALYDFTSEDADDLTFTLNTVIRVTLKGEDDELAAEVESGQADVSSEPRWWRGKRLENVGTSRDGTFPSNYVKVCGVEREMSLRHLLELPSGLKVFTDFLRQEYAGENISFWRAVEEYRIKFGGYLVGGIDALNSGTGGELKPEGRQPMLAEANRIARDFIGSSAASQVNISSSTLKMTQDRINALPESLGLNMFDEVSRTLGRLKECSRWQWQGHAR
jgi:hypothetical protein